jgi:hypothetical protein
MEQKSEALYSKLTKFVLNDCNNQDKILEKNSMITAAIFSQRPANAVIKCSCFESVNQN